MNSRQIQELRKKKAEELKKFGFYENSRYLSHPAYPTLDNFRAKLSSRSVTKEEYKALKQLSKCWSALNSRPDPVGHRQFVQPDHNYASEVSGGYYRILSLLYSDGVAAFNKAVAWSHWVRRIKDNVFRVSLSGRHVSKKLLDVISKTSKSDKTDLMERLYRRVY